MFNCGLLVVTSPLHVLHKHIPQLLKYASGCIRNTLYIHLQPGFFQGLTDQSSTDSQTKGTSKFCLLPISCNPEIRKAVFDIYQTGARVSADLDIQVLLSNISGTSIIEKGTSLLPSLMKYSLRNPCEVILLDRSYQDRDTCNSRILAELGKMFQLDNNPPVKCIGLNIDFAEESRQKPMSENQVDANLEAYRHGVMGGTFDRLHAGHKILLSDACLRCSRSVTVGVTDGRMNAKKTLSELILPIKERIAEVLAFMEEVKPRLTYKVVSILDPFGPSTVDPELECIVVSQETLRGGHRVNEERAKTGLSQLDIHCIDLVEDEHHSSDEEVKISSSSGRKRLLGTLLREIELNPSIPSSPRRIGLTGGIASGKSSVGKRLEGLGAAIIDCDKLGHQAYLPGTRTFDKLIQEFGHDIVGPSGEIDRKALSGKVFSDKNELVKLNAIVWPEIAKLAEQEIAEFAQGKAVVVLDAAVLLEAGWDTMVHEVWASIIPKEEAVKRIMERNRLSEEESLKRINSQMTSDERVSRSHIVLSTLWEYEVTQKQVEKAWRLLMERITSQEKSQSQL